MPCLANVTSMTFNIDLRLKITLKDQTFLLQDTVLSMVLERNTQ